MEVSAPGFLSELFRRKVVKVTLTYIAVAWMLIQAADIALESFSAPAYFMQAFMVFAVLGVPVVILLAWVLEVTPTGVRSEKSGRALGASSLRNAIAVLPFTNMSSDDELEHFADGLSDHIISGCQQRLGRRQRVDIPGQSQSIASQPHQQLFVQELVADYVTDSQGANVSGGADQSTHDLAPRPSRGK